MKIAFSRAIWGCCLLGAVLPTPWASSAPGDRLLANHVVTTDADAGPGSLRAALEDALRTPGPDRVTFGDADGLFVSPRVIELSSPLRIGSGEVTIDGFIEGVLWKAYGATISGGGRQRVFEVAPGATLRIKGITVANGRSVTGAGILNRGRLVLEGVTLMGNRADGEGGAIANDGGEVLVLNSTATDNRAERGGALANLAGALQLTHCTLYRNHANEGEAVFSRDRLTLANSILAGDGTQCVNSGVLGKPSGNNLITSQHGCGLPLLTGDPGLGPFGYYNGPTPVFTLADGSPVLNLADPAASVDEDGRPLVWDQRGNGDPRFTSGFAELGAFEQQGHLATTFLVDSADDNGLRGCTSAGRADCSLRAALELAAAARQPTTVRFEPTIFAEPRTIRLTGIPLGGNAPLVIDGAGAAPVTIMVPGPPLPWKGINGVHIQFDDGVASSRRGKLTQR